MQNGPAGEQQNQSNDKKQLLDEAASDLQKALDLFDAPISTGINYCDLLRVVASHPEYINTILDYPIEGLEEPQPLHKLLDGHDLTHLGSKDIEVMRGLLKRFPDQIVGADLLTTAGNHPELIMEIFENHELRSKLSGRQLAELGALNKEVAQRIKADESLWERITVNPAVDEVVQLLEAQKAEGELSQKEFNQSILPLLKEEKTFLHVGVLCQKNPELAQTLVDEGFLEKLNGEDLSFFAQYHADIANKVMTTPDLLAKLEGQDFKRLGVHHKEIALKILNSDELMKKAGPNVWCELSAKHPDFFQGFLVKFDKQVREYLQVKAKYEKTGKGSRPTKGDLLRFDAQFLITLADKIGASFSEYLYDQAINKKNPVSRFMLGLDDLQEKVDVNKVLSQLKRSLQAQGVRGPQLELQVSLTKARLEARNEQLSHAKYNVMCALAGISAKDAHAMIDDLLKFPDFLKELNSANLCVLAVDHKDVVLRILNEPKLADKISGSHLARLGAEHSEAAEIIWQNDAMRAKIVNHCNLPMLAGRYLQITQAGAQANGFMDEVTQYIRDNKNIHNKEVPKGYVWYLYNILYPHAEVATGIKSVLIQALCAQAEATDETTECELAASSAQSSILDGVDEAGSSTDSQSFDWVDHLDQVLSGEEGKDLSDRETDISSDEADLSEHDDVDLPADQSPDNHAKGKERTSNVTPMFALQQAMGRQASQAQQANEQTLLDKLRLSQ